LIEVTFQNSLSQSDGDPV